MHYELRKTEYPGGGWVVKATPAFTPGDEPIRPTIYAFRTLDAARKFIAQQTLVRKRVRMTRHSDTYYTYKA